MLAGPYTSEMGREGVLVLTGSEYIVGEVHV